MRAGSMLTAAVTAALRGSFRKYLTEQPKRNHGPRMVTSSDKEIAAWNKAVEAKKAAKLEARLRRNKIDPNL